VDKQVIMWMAMVTLIGFPMVGMALMIFFSEESISIMMRQRADIYTQAAWGIGVGTAMGVIAHMVSGSKLLEPSTRRYSRLLGALRLNTIDKVLISVCAGFGEELLFRGALQWFWGIWPTAVIFVLIHGYLDPRDWRISIYGLLMTIFIGILGYMMESLGIWSAILAHTMIDVVLLVRMKDDGPHIPIPSVEEDDPD